MSDYPPHIEALRVKALNVPIASYAIRARLKFSPPDAPERAGPCPRQPGSKDTLAINTAKNKWICRRCDTSGGDVISFAMHVDNLPFNEALERITGETLENVKRETPEQKAARDAQAEKDRQAAKAAATAQADEAAKRREEARKAGHAVWRQAIEVDWRPDAMHPVCAYLAVRRIDVAMLLQLAGGVESLKKVIRFAPALAYSIPKKTGKGWETVFEGPAMVCAVVLPDGRFGSAHRTWIDLSQAPSYKARVAHPHETEDDGSPKWLDPKKGLGTKGSGAIRLITPAGATRLVVGEGIETTLTVACREARADTAYWCLVDLGNMAGKAFIDGAGKRREDLPDMGDDKAFVPPDWVTEYVLLGDSDAKTERQFDLTYRKLLRGARRAMAAKPGRKSYLAMADRGMDFNDMGRAGMDSAPEQIEVRE